MMSKEKSSFWKNLLNVFIVILIVINIYFLVLHFINRDKNKQLSYKELLKSEIQENAIDKEDFFNSPCPIIKMTSIDNKEIDISKLTQNVIVIKFSKFYKSDLANLLYLEHISRKFKDYGIKVIYVNTMGKHDSISTSKYCILKSSIVEDDGSILSAFNANTDDLVIIDRNNKIKFKYSIFNKRLIHNEIRKYIFGEQQSEKNISSREMTSAIEKLKYFDVLENKEKFLFLQNEKRNLIITFFTSVCMTCEVNSRIQLMTSLSTKLYEKNWEIYFFLGSGNTPFLLRQLTATNNWNDYPITIGIIDESFLETDNDYFNLFSLETDPRTIISSDDPEYHYIENLSNSRLLESKLNEILDEKN